MKLLFIIGQEEDGRYVSIKLDQVVYHDSDGSRDSDSDSPSGIIESITPEQEAEEERIENDKKVLDLGDLSKVLEKNSKK